MASVWPVCSSPQTASFILPHTPTNPWRPKSHFQGYPPSLGIPHGGDEQIKCHLPLKASTRIILWWWFCSAFLEMLYKQFCKEFAELSSKRVCASKSMILHLIKISALKWKDAPSEWNYPWNLITCGRLPNARRMDYIVFAISLISVELGHTWKPAPP